MEIIESFSNINFQKEMCTGLCNQYLPQDGHDLKTIH